MSTSRAVGSVIACLALSAVGCAPASEPEIIAHRALGLGADGEENLPELALGLFEAGFGVELDVRSDGEGCQGAEPPEISGCFDLGHWAGGNGHTLEEIFGLLVDHWQPAFAGQTLVIDVADDSGDVVSRSLLDYLHSRLLDTPAEALPMVIETSSEISLARLAEANRRNGAALGIQFAMTYFSNPDFTPPDDADAIICPVLELPTYGLPSPTGVWGVSDRREWLLAVNATSPVEMVITDYPTRVALFE